MSMFFGSGIGPVLVQVRPSSSERSIHTVHFPCSREEPLTMAPSRNERLVFDGTRMPLGKVLFGAPGAAFVAAALARAGPRVGALAVFVVEPEAAAGASGRGRDSSRGRGPRASSNGAFQAPPVKRAPWMVTSAEPSLRAGEPGGQQIRRSSTPRWWSAVLEGGVPARACPLLAGSKMKPPWLAPAPTRAQREQQRNSGCGFTHLLR